MFFETYLFQTLLLMMVPILIKSQPTAQPLMSPCPEECTCTSLTFTVNCSHGARTDLPRVIPNTTLSLTLSHNNIQNISQDAFIEMSALVFLDLSYNPYLTLDKNLDSLLALQHLRSVNLQATGLQNSPLGLPQFPKSLAHLSLGQNTLTNVLAHSTDNRSIELKTLDIHRNRLTEVSEKLFVFCPKLHTLIADWNHIEHFQLNFSTWETKYFDSVVEISLSHNFIASVNSKVFSVFPQLEKLNIGSNNITDIGEAFFEKCSNLRWLSLANNPIQDIPNLAFIACNNLRELNISGLNVSAVHTSSFEGLINLRKLDFSHSKIIQIHQEAFLPTRYLEFLDLSYNGLISVSQSMFSFTSTSTEEVNIRLDQNAWHCDCSMKWLATWFNFTKAFIQHRVPTCSSPTHLKGLSLQYLPYQLNCSNAKIINYTRSAYKKIGDSVILDCIAEGDPVPNVVWVTPTKQVFHYQAQNNSHGRNATLYYKDRYSSMDNTNSMGNKQVQVLENGSLYIDFVSRHEAGTYICRAFNEHGNSSVVIQFTLNYLIIFEVTIWSVIYGMCCAAGMFLIGILVGTIRELHSRFSRSEKEKRKGIAQVLQNLIDYKSVQIGKLSAYKTAKLDQLSAFKNSKVDKLRMYKQASFHSIVQHMHNLREHYTSQVGKVKDNYSQQVEYLRENYNSQTVKFRTYKSSKVGKLKGYKAAKLEKLRDQYNTQVLKMREYGSQQMTKLSEQYRLQQQHLLKLLELLDIGNCMGYIEAECLRSDSMMFSENFMNIDLETHSIHTSLCSDINSENSEYITASSQSDNSMTGSIDSINTATQLQCNISNTQSSGESHSLGTITAENAKSRPTTPLESQVKQNSHANNTKQIKKKTNRRRKSKKKNANSGQKDCEKECEMPPRRRNTLEIGNTSEKTCDFLVTSTNQLPEVTVNIAEHERSIWHQTPYCDLNTSSEDVTPKYSPQFSPFPSDSSQSSPEKLCGVSQQPQSVDKKGRYSRETQI